MSEFCIDEFLLDVICYDFPFEYPSVFIEFNFHKFSEDEYKNTVNIFIRCILSFVFCVVLPFRICTKGKK